MGFLKKLFGNGDEKFIEIVRASDNGEDWAQNEIRRMWENNDTTLLPRIHRARAVIYEDAAMRGDRDAIIKYARGLEWLGREHEALEWYMKLINQGDTDAMLELASDYTEFGGMGENGNEQFKWIKRAAEAGNAEGQAKLSLEYGAKGDMINENIWAEKSAAQGNIEGKRMYADVLNNEMFYLTVYENGDNVDEYTQFLLNKYGINSPQDCASTKQGIYSKAEQLYIDYLNEGNDEAYLSMVHRSLARLYLNPPKNTFAQSPYLAAYFYYMDYYNFDTDDSFEKLKKIVRDFNLNVSNETLSAWQNVSIYDWAQQNGIEL